MSRHRHGSHSREIDVAVVRAWIAAGRPAQGPRAWRHSRAQGDRWVWWPLLSLVVVVLSLAAVVAVVAGVDPLERPRGYARNCTSCHAYQRAEIMEINVSRQAIADSVTDLDNARNALSSASVDLIEAKNRLTAVKAAGYELAPLTEALAAIEVALNDLDRVRRSSALAAGKAREAMGVRGGFTT